MSDSEEKKTQALPRQRRSWLRTIVMSTVILVCGMVIGGGITLYIATERILDAVQNPQGVPVRIVERMQRHLDLTEEQATAIEAIVERHQSELLAIRAEVKPRVKVELDAMQGEIETVLTPEQVQRFRQRVESLRARLFPSDGGHDLP